MRVLRYCLIVAAVFLIFPAVVPHRRIQYANGMGAMKTITILHAAETWHFSQFGKFAGSLPELASAGETLPVDLARTGDAAGYRFTLFLTARG